VPKEDKGRIQQDPPTGTKSRLLELEREIQRLRLELEEKDRILNSTRHDLAVQIKGADKQTETNVRDQMERLFSDVGGPIVQLIAQDYLTNVEGKAVSTKDVLAVTNRFIKNLKNYGLDLIGSMGETLCFDPALHEPLSLDDQISKGEEVTVRILGLLFDGKVLRRAAVTRVGS
jgi:molecular chaperone GrpE (heat shock protein)